MKRSGFKLKGMETDNAERNGCFHVGDEVERSGKRRKAGTAGFSSALERIDRSHVTAQETNTTFILYYWLA